MMLMFVLLAQPHSSIPYIHMGFIATLYSRILFSSFRSDFLPNNQSNFFVITSICFLLASLIHKLSALLSEHFGVT
jgi:hypothetical protein